MDGNSQNSYPCKNIDLKIHVGTKKEVPFKGPYFSCLVSYVCKFLFIYKDLSEESFQHGSLQ